MFFEFEEDEIKFNPNEDGITHINIYSKGRTELGKMLSNFYLSPFMFEPYGQFNSGEAFWYWYLTGQKHNTLKLMSGYSAKKKGQELGNDRIDAFGLLPSDEAVICEMLVHKIRCNPDIALALKNSTLPFVHYYVFSGEVVPVLNCNWLCETYESIREVLKQ